MQLFIIIILYIYLQSKKVDDEFETGLIYGSNKVKKYFLLLTSPVHDV